MLKYSDEEVLTLVKKVKKGDVNAFEQLVIIYQKFVYGTVLADVKNKEDAEDISQEVFLKVWNSIGSFRADSSFATWLHKIAKNTTFDFLRKRSKRKEISEDPDSALAVIPSNDPSPEDTVIGNETVNEIEKIIDTLPEEQRISLIYRDLMGITYLEIADITGVTVGTVKSRISRARETVKNAIEKYLFADKK